LWALRSSLRFDQQSSPGRIAMPLRIIDPAFEEYRLPGGLSGQAAIDTEHFRHLSIMREILLRMAAWMSDGFPLH
jgi:hypothetical protein